VPQTLVIDRRFRGPPESGNGGYVAGLAAKALGAGATEVTLLAPPPLDAPIEVRIDGAEIALVHGDRELVRARSAALDFEAPPAPAMIAAAAARGRYVGLREPHLIPGCFVCGPARLPGDGLRIFAGPLDPRPGGAAGVAATWLPDDDLTEDDGLIAREFLWAALDCPSYFALPRANALMALLGRMTAEIRERPRAGEPLAVAAWATGSEGRKHAARSALYGADGRLLAKAACLWIELKPKEG
jgi:hypothetical protein